MRGKGVKVLVLLVSFVVAAILVGCEPPPEARFSASPITVSDERVETFVNDLIRFKDESVDGSSLIYRWLWKFGDGFESIQRNPQYRYQSPGLYTVSLTVTNQYGSHTLTKDQYIQVTECDDSDGDGISDCMEEAYYGTDPNKWDTSGDGFSDGFLANSGRDPLQSYATPAENAFFADGKNDFAIIEENLEEGYVIVAYPSNKSDPINVGDILISTQNGGFLLEITGMEILEEKYSWLGWVVVKLMIQLASIGDAYNSFSDEDFHIDLSYRPLVTTSEEVYNDGSLIIVLTSEISFDSGLTMNINVAANEIQSLSASMDGRLYVDVTLDIVAEDKLLFESDPIYFTSCMPLYTDGIFTVYGCVPLRLYFTGEGIIDLDTGFYSVSDVNFGTTYDAATQEFSQTSHTLSLRRNLKPVTLVDHHTTAEFRVEVIPRLEVQVYRQAGMYAQLMPHIYGDISSPCPAVSTVGMGIWSEIGLYSELFGLFETNPTTKIPANPIQYSLYTSDCGVDPTEGEPITQYTLTYTAGAGGWIEGNSQQTVNHGEDGTEVTAVADTDYHFVAWSDGVLTASRTDVNVTDDITVTAEFTSNVIIMLPGDVPLELVRIPAGTFMMGSPTTEISRNSDETQHSVTLSQDFFMGKYEVTQAQWLALMGSWPGTAPSTTYGVGDNYPAYWMSWNDAQNFITALNAHITSTFQGVAPFRLPTEAEWEYACRGGRTMRFYFGDSLNCDEGCQDCAAGVLWGKRSDYMWYCGNTYSTKPVGGKLPNAFGLYDMHGNVQEWCQDWYESYPIFPVIDPTGPTSGSYRVFRGGSWYDYAYSCRSASRSSFPPAARPHYLGFRVAWASDSSVEVPDMVGVAEAVAVAAIEGAGLVAAVDTAYSDDVPAGDVISQDPVAGAMALPAATVTIVVSLGPEPASEVTILLPGDVPLKLVWIPAGTFMMGRYPDEQDSNSSEDPQHSVTLSQDFSMGKYEVTQAQWLALMGSWPGTAPSSSNGVGDNYPAYYVSWNDAQNFITALNTHIISTGQGAATFRLPTEAEWEYACRAGTTTRFYWGDDPGYTQLGDYAWGGTISSYGTKPVGGKLPNAFGLYDMSGNVWEYCQDWYGSYPSGSVTDPTGSTTGTNRVLRGGCWYDDADVCRAAHRNSNGPDNRLDCFGFRVARASDSVEVPDVIGLAATVAVAAIEDAGMVAAVEAAESEDVPAGDVISQDPVAGAMALPGATVTIVVSFGPEPGSEVTIMLPGDVPLELVRIPAGTFMMGSPTTEISRNSNETQHSVTLSQDFFMGKYEVTQAQWLALMGSWPGTAPSTTYGVGDNYPAYWMSWNDAQNFITALNAHITSTFQGVAPFRLPAEAEWEYACRAGTTRRFYFGDSLNCDEGCQDCAAGVLPGKRSDYMWYCGNNSPYGTKPVGGKLPNAFGLYDMHGNVQEWCQDWYESYPIGSVTDPTGPTSGANRVFRGGFWNFYAYSCRSASRSSFPPAARPYYLGFRLAR